MLCERCQEQEATVHWTVVMGSHAETALHNFCVSCYPTFEAEHLKTYNWRPNSPLPAEVEHISAKQYLEAGAKAARNGIDKPAFKHIQNELKRFPKARQRLALEMLKLAWENLEHRKDPGEALGTATSWWGSIEPECLAAYKQWVEKIMVRCCELHQDLAFKDSRFLMPVLGCAMALRQIDLPHFQELFESLTKRWPNHELLLKLAEFEAKMKP